jgi:hypothetical protein
VSVTDMPATTTTMPPSHRNPCLLVPPLPTSRVLSLVDSGVVVAAVVTVSTSPEVPQVVVEDESPPQHARSHGVLGRCRVTISETSLFSRTTETRAAEVGYTSNRTAGWVTDNLAGGGRASQVVATTQR